MTHPSRKPLLVRVSGILLPALACVSAPFGSLPKSEAPTSPHAAAGPAKQNAEVVLPPAAAERLARAKELAAAGKLADAEGELAEADRIQPDSGPILDALARLQIQAGKTDAALATIERLVRRAPSLDDRIYILAAQILAKQGRHVDGEKLLIQWAGDRPLAANFLSAIGILRLGVFDFSGAEPPILKALELDPVNEPALKAIFQIYGRLGRYDRAQPLLDRAVELEPRSAQARMLSGSSLMRQQKFVEARYQFQKIVEFDKRNAAAWVNLGSAAYSAGDREQGLTALRTAIEIDGRNLEAPINLATALEGEKRFAEARDILLAARKRGIESVDLLNALAVAHHLSGELDAAIATLRQSLARDRDQEPVRKLIQRIESEREASAPGSAPAPGSASPPVSAPASPPVSAPASQPASAPTPAPSPAPGPGAR